MVKGMQTELTILQTQSVRMKVLLGTGAWRSLKVSDLQLHFPLQIPQQHIHARTLTHTPHRHMRRRTPLHACTCTCAHTHARIRTQTPARTRTHTSTHIHAHPNTPSAALRPALAGPFACISIRHVWTLSLASAALLRVTGGGVTGGTCQRGRWAQVKWP